MPTPTDFLRDLPAPAELLARPVTDVPVTNNAHIHLPPNFSAFDSVAQAVNLAAAQGVAVLGASNYYDYTVYEPFTRLALDAGIFPLFGLEIITLDDEMRDAGVLANDPGNPGKVYICGKGITGFAPLSPNAGTLLNTIRDRDSERMAQMAQRLADVFVGAGLDTGLTARSVKERVVARHGSPIESVYLQERHIAQAFQEVIFERVTETDHAELLSRAFGGSPKSAPGDANGLQGEIRSALMKAGKPGFVPETFVSRDHAFRLITALGGIPCYPTLADGTKPLCGFEIPVAAWVERLQTLGFSCAEFIPIRNSPEVLAEYVRAVRDAGIVVTAGTEHNTRDLVPIAPTCVNGAPIPGDTAAIFAEGACVVAAHQYLVARGETGFVDANNVPNTAFVDAGSRIAYFATLGRAVIAAVSRRGQ